MANNTSLKAIGEYERTLNNFIITSDPKTVSDQDNTGNVVIYISDGQPFFAEDFYNEEYRDLYIGDEHVAGGFGFKNINTRNDAIAYVFSEFPEKFNEHDERLKHIETVFGSIGDDYQDPNLIINPIYNTIETSYGSYKLNYQSGELRVVNDVRPTIHDVKVEFYDGRDVSVVENCGRHYHSVINPLYLRKISFIYEGTAEIDSFYLSYRGASQHEYDQDVTEDPAKAEDINDLYGTYRKPFRMNFVDSKWEYPFKDVRSKYFLKDPNRYPNVIQRLIEIEFVDNFLLLGTADPKEDLYDFKIALIDHYAVDKSGYYVNSEYKDNKDYNDQIYKVYNRKTVKTIATIAVELPIYYGTSADIPNFDIYTLQNIFETEYISDFDEIKDLTFRHGTTESYAWIFVPAKLFGVPIGGDSNENIWYNEDILLRTVWYEKGDVGNIPNSDIDSRYYLYRSPNKYKGQVNWKIKLVKA